MEIDSLVASSHPIDIDALHAARLQDIRSTKDIEAREYKARQWREELLVLRAERKIKSAKYLVLAADLDREIGPHFGIFLAGFGKHRRRRNA